MNRIYVYIQQYIGDEFDVFRLDEYLSERSTIYDFVILLVHNHNIKGEFKFTDTEFCELMASPRDMDLIAQSLSEKFVEIFNIKFRSDIHEIIYSGLQFPHSGYNDMLSNIEKRKK